MQSADCMGERKRWIFSYAVFLLRATICMLHDVLSVVIAAPYLPQCYLRIKLTSSGLPEDPFSLNKLARDESGQIITRHWARAGPQGRTAITGGTEKRNTGLKPVYPFRGSEASPRPTQPAGLPGSVQRSLFPPQPRRETRKPGRDQTQWAIHRPQAGLSFPRQRSGTAVHPAHGAAQLRPTLPLPSTAPPGGWRGAHGGNLVPSRERTAVVTVRQPPLFASFTRK